LQFSSALKKKKRTDGFGFPFLGRKGLAVENPAICYAPPITGAYQIAVLVKNLIDCI
jgi:hypothetical protein